MLVNLKKAFSILDGRLSTEMGDVYEMLNYIFNTKFYIYQLPKAMDILLEDNPDWFRAEVNFLQTIKEKNKTDDFQELMNIIDKEYPTYKIKLKKHKMRI